MDKTKLPKVSRYLMVQSQYGGSGQLAYLADGETTPQVFGSVNLPDKSGLDCGPATPAVKAAREKEAERQKQFCEMVVRHLNAGLANEVSATRMSRRAAMLKP